MKLRYSVASCMLALGTLSAVPAIAADTASNQGYYRAPALHDQTLVFTAEGDLWTQTLGQKAATRLTSLPAEELGASISADGKWVAYVANYEGASEVYVIPVTGGVAKRVSFENSRVRVQGFTAKGDILYSTDSGFGPANNWMLRSVDPKTLTTTDLPLADAVEGVIDDNNDYVYFTRFGLQVTGDNAKVYRVARKANYGVLNSAVKPKHSYLAVNTTVLYVSLCCGRTDSILSATAMVTITCGRWRSMVQTQNS